MGPRASRVAFAAVFFAVAASLVIAAARWMAPRDAGFDAWLLVALLGFAVCAVTAWIAAAGPSRSATPPPPPAQPLGAESAYRGAAPPSAPVVVASARRTTALLLATLAFTAAVVPFALHLPRWIEAEVVMVTWWIAWSSVLGVLAYRGHTLHDDHVRESAFATMPAKPKWTWAGDVLGAVSDPEGCVLAIAFVVVAGIAFAGAWLVVELLAPAVFLVAYRGVVRALARVSASETRGRALRSTLVGLTWATAYTAPLAAVVALGHLVLR